MKPNRASSHTIALAVIMVICVMAAQAKADALAAEQSFYTGKPYLPATGSYAFKYRSYQPELARWTSEDPSGFPDGANNIIYSNSPTNGFDALGLAWGNIDFLKHFYTGNGAAVTLRQIGLYEGVRTAANSPGGGIYNFDKQINDKAKSIDKPYNGQFKDSFEKGYDFGEVLFSLGGGVLSSDYTGNMTSTPLPGDPLYAGEYKYTGDAVINYSDDFTDPLSVIELLYGSSNSPDVPSWLKIMMNLGGTPFKLSETFKQTFKGEGKYFE